MAVVGKEPVSTEDLQSFRGWLDPYIKDVVSDQFQIMAATWRGSVSVSSYIGMNLSGGNYTDFASVTEDRSSDLIYKSTNGNTNLLFVNPGTYQITSSSLTATGQQSASRIVAYINDGGSDTSADFKIADNSGSGKPLTGTFSVDEQNKLMRFRFQVWIPSSTTMRVTMNDMRIQRIS